MGEHTIEIYIKNEKIDATPSFYTYDATKIKVGDIPSGLIGMPVDFNGKITQCFLRVLKLLEFSRLFGFVYNFSA